MGKAIKSELNKYLKHLDKTGLEKEVMKLFSKFDNVKQFYELELGEDTANILNKFKTKIENEYLPARGFGRSSNKASKKLVSDFKKISIHQKDVVELLLYRVEVMIEYTTYLGDINESFYNSLLNSFEEACKLIHTEQLKKIFQSKCENLINKTVNIGWGLQDEMWNQYGFYLPD